MADRGAQGGAIEICPLEAVPAPAHQLRGRQEIKVRSRLAFQKDRMRHWRDPGGSDGFLLPGYAQGGQGQGICPMSSLPHIQSGKEVRPGALRPPVRDAPRGAVTGLVEIDGKERELFSGSEREFQFVLLLN